jgi:hypothetical protein
LGILLTRRNPQDDFQRAGFTGTSGKSLKSIFNIFKLKYILFSVAVFPAKIAAVAMFRYGQVILY